MQNILTYLKVIGFLNSCIKMWESVHNNFRQYEVKLSRLSIRNTRLTHGHLMSRDDQQLTCINVACKNHTLKIKHYLEKYNTQNENIIGQRFKVEKIKMFLKEIESIFQEI